MAFIEIDTETCLLTKLLEQRLAVTAYLLHNGSAS